MWQDRGASASVCSFVSFSLKNITLAFEHMGAEARSDFGGFAMKVVTCRYLGHFSK
jgi:hypothetical protein